MNPELKKYLAEQGAKGGKKSRRKLSKKEARRIAMVRWAAGAGRGAVKRGTKKGKAPNGEHSNTPTQNP
jgi:hypothetical protein